MEHRKTKSHNSLRNSPNLLQEFAEFAPAPNSLRNSPILLQEFAAFAPGIHRICSKNSPNLLQEFVEKRSIKKSIKTSSRNGVCLVGKLLGHLGGVFLDYLEAPSSHIRQNIFGTDLLQNLIKNRNYPYYPY